MDMIEYVTKVRELFVSTNAYRNVENVHAVVVERIARGGGATNWYYCRNESDLESIIPELRPGSVVSLYFDGRLKVTRNRKALHAEVAKIIDQLEDCVVGVLKDGSIKFDIDFVTGIEELTEFTEGVQCSAIFMFGAFLGRDNDGDAAI